MSTLILRTAAKILVPLSMLFAMFVYFKGHQTPGGGFVAGLVAAVALIVHRMSFGAHSMNRMLPFPERTFISMGLALALGTGAAALLFGQPLLSSNHGHVSLASRPGTTMEFEWATVMLFDLGVFLIVTGVVVGMINTLSEELEICHLPEESP